MSQWRKVDIIVRLGFIVVFILVAAVSVDHAFSSDRFIMILFICLASSFVISGVIAFFYKEQKAGWVNTIAGVIMFTLFVWM
ncbi:hypothetical protein [Alkalicoccobacillus murimartini]|uniref:DUF3953 domain-containing protein n=1 Tax=Alkalicoccobacillus murimartini TaxID=171685 RepID=A0ABT9YD25_9BACI|nr:hypothetical protein [Alkalicoccobacillus murimartini]MDQ0205380.1 hypothetical protein [Alkalicoccobacillus murimartini]